VKRTSPEVMHPFYQAGPSAITALWRYESNIFGDDYRDNFLATSFNLRKVTRHILKPNGATFASTDSDFLVSDNTDFHPTDVLEDADGSLLVVDTGGWYKLCCPSSQLAKPDVLGGIYRVRRAGAKRLKDLNDPRGFRIDWTEIGSTDVVNRLSEIAGPANNRRAIEQLAKMGKPIVPQLRQEALGYHLRGSRSRCNAIWALTRINDPTAREVVRFVLADKDEMVLCAAIQSVSLWRDAAAKDRLVGLMKSENPRVQRLAAEALGRIGDKSVVPGLFAAISATSDPTLEHSLTYALIELGDAATTASGLQSSDPRQLRAALVALDQMDGGNLKADMAAPLLGSDDPALRQTAAWVASHHPDWGGALAGFFRKRLNAQNLSDADRAELARQLTQFAGDGAIQQLMADVLSEVGTANSIRQTVLNAMVAANLKAVPAGWVQPVRMSLESKNTDLVQSAVAAARVLAQVKSNAPDFSRALLGIGRDEARTAELRLEALAALPGGVKSVEPGLLSFLCANLSPTQSVAVRSAAASVLAKAKLGDDQLLTLAETIKTTGPLEVTKLLEAFEQSKSEEVGLKLMAALRESKGLSGARPDAIKTLAAKYPVSVQEQSGKLLALLNVDEAKQKAHLDALLASLPKGDIRAGQAVFNSQRTACAACHKTGYVGGTVGPDLTSIGQARTERDLLEAIVYPSASFVRSYEPVIVTTKTDEEYSGVLRKDAADEIVLATGANTEARIARSDINEMRPSQVSVMPGGLDEQLTKQELADLVAFLKGTKWGPN
jgi:putative heme-binding domain-containing protein